MQTAITIVSVQFLHRWSNTLRKVYILQSTACSQINIFVVINQTHTMNYVIVGLIVKIFLVIDQIPNMDYVIINVIVKIIKKEEQNEK